ncbi:MAG: hypothetical protein ACJAUV_000776 [Flavobacteriales bacterium]
MSFLLECRVRVFCLIASFGFAVNGLGLEIDQNKKAALEKNNLVNKLFDELIDWKEKSMLQWRAKSNNDGVEQLGFQFFGRHPYMLSGAYMGYQYHFLTSISSLLCSVSLNESDSLIFNNSRLNSEKIKPLFNRATQDSCNAFLGVSFTKLKALEKLLKESDEQELFIKNVVDLIDSFQDTNGINLVLDRMPENCRDELTDFVSKLSHKLHSLNCVLVVDLPPLPDDNRYDIAKLSKLVDQFVVHGYKYNLDIKNPGPAAPLGSRKEGDDFDLEKTVAGYLKAGLEKDKFILALPHYGLVWKVDSTSKVVSYSFHKKLLSNGIKNELETLEISAELDLVTFTKYYRYKAIDGSDYICFFDDEQTLLVKSMWAKKMGLRGVGTDFLGYSKNYKEVWLMLKDDFTIEKDYNLKNIRKTFIEKTLLQLQYGTVKTKSVIGKLVKQDAVALLMLSVLFGFIVLGLLMGALSKDVWQVLLIYNIKTYVKRVLILIIVVACCLLFSWFLFDSDAGDGHIFDNQNHNLMTSCVINKLIVSTGVLGLIMLTALSYQSVFKFNKDKP